MAETLIATAAGEFAPTFLTKEATKVGIKQFIQTYGSVAFRTVAPAITGGMLAAKAVEAYPPVDLQKEKLFGVPLNRITGQNTGYNDIEEPKKVEPLKYIPEIHGGKSLPPTEQESLPAQTEVKKWDEGFKKPDLIETNKGFEVPPQTKAVPPGFDIPDTVDTSILTKDIAKQTKDLVKEEPEFGALTETEKQTAIALKGDKPDYYSRAIEAIETAKDDTSTKGRWASILKSSTTKEELDYLGLTELLVGKESISKQELLKLVKDKDIAARMTVSSIPKDQMNPMFKNYSLGFEQPGTQEHIVFQSEGTGSDLYNEPHFMSTSPTYALGTFAHARTQVGFGDSDAPPVDYDYLDPKIFDKLINTQIVDEIQSKHIQRLQEEGSVKDWKLIKGSDVTKEFIEKNYSGKYELKTSKYSTLKQTLEKTGLRYNKVLYTINPDLTEGTVPGPVKQVLTRIDSDRYYTFGKARLSSDSKFGFKNKEDAQKHIEEKGLPDLPIKETKKFVELVLNELIKRAVMDGRDSIAITNGQIQYNRYPETPEKNRLGLKKVYNTIHYDQLNKIAKKYNLELERITISPTANDKKGLLEKEKEDQNAAQLQFPKKVKTAQNAGHTLQKLSGGHLDELIDSVTLPGHASIYTNEGRGQGADYMLNVLNNEKHLEAEYYVWTKEKISEDVLGEHILEDFKKVNWDIPIVYVKDTITNEAVKGLVNASTEDREHILKQFTIGGEAGYPYAGDNINNMDLIKYTEYLRNYKPPEGIDLSYEEDPEQLIKMEFPKKLQKDFYGKRIFLTKKMDKQTDRLFA